MKTQLIKEIKDNGLTSESEIYFYMKGKGMVDINILENIKSIMGKL